MAQLKSSTSNEAKSDTYSKHNFEPDDEEVSMIFGFEENDARQKLHNFPKCSRLVISPDLQAELGMEIGTAVSVEHPWKEIKKEMLEDHLPGKTKVQRQLKDKLKDMETGKLILVGYLPDQSTEEEDLFAVFTDNRETREARELIRRLELVERLAAAAAMRKKPRRWQSRGSEQDVENFIPLQRTNVVNVESQSIYPAQRVGSFRRFQLRMVGDARDGYVELVPKTVFRNIVRKSIDFGVQLRPQKVHTFQQTDPTFPTNAWSQYLYEIGSEPKMSTTTTTATTTTAAAGSVGPTGQPVSPSDHVEQLLHTLEFNQIDMYRNDYPIISRHKSIAKYETPIVEETMCFMDRSTCANRHVSAIEWHPQLTGTFVAAYVHHIPSVLMTVPITGSASDGQEAAAGMRTIPSGATVGAAGGREDAINRLVFEKCPVLAWNFEESLMPKLWLDSPREVTALSFCPYDGRLLVGGLSSGQIAIWELTDAQLEHTGPRTGGREHKHQGHHPAPDTYRNEIKLLLGNATPTNRLARGRTASAGGQEHTTLQDGTGAPETPWHVRPAVISALERSARKPITVIRWLPQNYHAVTTGQLRVNSAEDGPGRFLLTAALDGTVSIWNLDLPVPAALSAHDKQQGAGELDTVGETTPTGGGLARLNHVFHPTYRVRCEVPIVTLALDEQPIALRGGGPSGAFQLPPVICHQAFIAGTLLGGLFWGKWDGYEFDQGAVVNEEPMRDRDTFAAVHNGPLVAIARNTFVPEVLLTAGGTVLALWTVDCRQSPIFWRVKPAAVTACVWSLDRPSVFYVGLANGDLEIWDLQIHTSTPCVTLNLGANVLSIITQQHHRRTPHRHLAVADGNCNVRLLSIPAAFAEPRPSERKRFRQLIRAELARKHDQSAWVQRYYEQNREQIEAKLRAEREARELAERLEVEKQEHDDFLRRQAIEEAKKKALRDAEKRVDLSRRLEGRWRSRYYRALIRTMMARRHLSPELLAKQMHPERERRRYDVRKRATIGESVAAAPGDYRRVQTSLEPEEARARVALTVREEATRLRETVRARFQEELSDYPRVSWEAKEVLRNFRLPLELDSVVSIIAKGRARRELVLSDDHGNLEHLQTYLAKQTARGSAADGDGMDGPANGEETDSNGTNVSPEGRRAVGLQRARSVTFIDDVPKPSPDLQG
ncbi:dynein axonemal intermediate chain 3-like [Anopheles maculipalpis]|uniref:dynein axonemal intermediate chain 3-like n=1 Tax=Anopheles maculipalpis TaxID=1496333 RepID=UPI002158E0E3|nr:dynein axonemal intermediate chain 3-like [Anopheles maculipalpis]